MKIPPVDCETQPGTLFSLVKCPKFLTDLSVPCIHCVEYAKCSNYELSGKSPNRILKSTLHLKQTDLDFEITQQNSHRL